MSILCDYEINTAIAVGNVKLKPYDKQNLQPNSYDVSLDDTIILSNGDKVKLPYTLKHGEFILGSTVEKVELIRNVCAQINGKSTNARNGLCVHLTAGFIDCGFKGNITLEMVNFGNDIELIPNMKIGQLIFYESSTPMNLYDGHYQNQEGVTPAYNSSITSKRHKR